jgi:hypothetical protein
MGFSTTDETADVDGVVRRTKAGGFTEVVYPPGEPPSNLAGRRVVVPGLAVTAALDAFNVDKQFVTYTFGSHMLFGGDLDPTVWVPIDALGRMVINYVGPPGSFPAYSFVDVGRGEVPAETFADKVVLVGLTAPNEPETEMQPTPFAAASPRVEITANALHSLLQRDYVRHEPSKTVAFLLIFGVAVGMLVPMFRLGLDALVAMGLFALYFGVAVLALKVWNVLLPVLPVLLLTVMAYAVMLIMHTFLRAPRPVLVE